MTGSIKAGGRYNIRDVFGALYLGIEKETCGLEIGKFDRNGDFWKPDAFFLWKYSVDLYKLIHLDGDARTRIGVTFREITRDGDHQWSESIGFPLYNRGIEGILRPSAKHPIAEKSLDIFLDNVQGKSYVCPDELISDWPGLREIPPTPSDRVGVLFIANKDDYLLKLSLWQDAGIRPGNADQFYGVLVPNGDIANLPRFSNVTRSEISFVSIAGTNANDDDLRVILKLKNLRSLDVSWMRKLKGKAFGDVRNSSLQRLKCAGTRLSQVGLSAIAEIPTLRYLDLAWTSTSSRILQSLRFSKRLEVLNLRSSEANDRIVKYLLEMRDLKTINLAFTRISERSGDSLSACSSLQELILAGTEISDDSIIALKALPSLQILNLFRTRVSDKCVPHLSAMNYLRNLNIKETRITRRGFLQLQSALDGCNIEY